MSFLPQMLLMTGSGGRRRKDALLKNALKLSFPEIGRIFTKHHSTAIYAVDNIQKMRQSNPDFDATMTAFHDQFE